jgi:hypothetical protein
VQLKPGLRLRSQVCLTEVIVVRPPAEEIELLCGGKPMTGLTEPVDPTAAPAPGLDTGTEMGKRYTTDDESSLEVLVTKAGAGTLAAGDAPLVLKDAKPLPSSD